MKDYIEIADHLGLAGACERCLSGKIKLPLSTYKPAEWYGYPPAFIPILSDGSGPTYLGIWKHWFGTRSASFVKMYVEDRHHVVEIARTSEQFFSYLAILSIVENDSVTKELIFFADQVGLSNLEAIDQVTLQSGDDPAGFTALECFRTQVPFMCFANSSNYDGSFPSLKLKTFEHISPFEVNEESALPSNLVRPSWFGEVNKPELFNYFLEKGDMEAAWLCLNSRGWRYGDAVTALNSLGKVARDPFFLRLVTAWSSFALSTPDAVY